jgi:hypothetical protein
MFRKLSRELLRDFSPELLARLVRRFSHLAIIAIIASCATLVSGVLLQGCFGSYWTHSDNDYTVGEEHTVDFPDQQTFVMTQDVLRGQGVLFDTKPGYKIITMWKPADQPEGTFSNLVGNVAQYRYEIEIAPVGSRRSTIVANLRAENIPTADIDSYKPNKKLNLFSDFDQLAAKLPPPALTPGSGGVNFAVLPGEDLAALSKRVTGNPDNWPQIAKDNGLKSVHDTSGLQSVWIASSLLPKAKPSTSHPGATP